MTRSIGSSTTSSTGGDKAYIFSLLAEVTDPEIPVLTIEEMGILRAAWFEGSRAIVEITPTYSGCPAIDQISDDIRSTLVVHGHTEVEVRRVLAPAWTTDWLSESSRQKLEAYGVAPPCQTSAINESAVSLTVRCPQCRSSDTKVLSEFGSTGCKALWKCNHCQEPFDFFKPL